MTRPLLITLALLLVVGLGAAAWLGQGPLGRTDVPTGAAERGPFEITLTVTGELEAVNSVVVTAPSEGGNKKITQLADEGTRVAAGDVVVAFDTTDFEKEVRLAQNDLAVAETRIEQQQAKAGRELGELDVALAKARLAVERAQLTMTDSETVARIERERARLTYEEERIGQTKLENDRALKERDLASELRLLELERDKVVARLEQAEEALASCTVKAPASGLVILSKAWKGSGWGTVEEGDSVWPGQNVLEIPDLSVLRAVVQVHEVDASQVAVGQRAHVTVDAFPGPVYDAEVSQIANLATTLDRSSKVKYFRTLLSLAQTSETMKPGMTTKVEIRVETLVDAVSVPREAVFDGPSGPQVYVRDGGGFAARSVELGKANATRVVVVSGVEAGEEVALTDPTVEPAEDAPGDPPAARPDGA